MSHWQPRVSWSALTAWFCQSARRIFSKCSPKCRLISTRLVSNRVRPDGVRASCAANSTNRSSFASLRQAVFLKDVTHAALKDLIQFMYCGEVNVKQDALPAFISTAEALQIKGLTGSHVPIGTVASAPTPASTSSRPRIRRSSVQPTSDLKLEDGKQTGVTQRPLECSIPQQSAPKCLNFTDPLEVAARPQQEQPILITLTADGDILSMEMPMETSAEANESSVGGEFSANDASNDSGFKGADPPEIKAERKSQYSIHHKSNSTFTLWLCLSFRFEWQPTIRHFFSRCEDPHS